MGGKAFLLVCAFAFVADARWFPAITTRYWDCCKPSCAWSGKARVTRPVEVCQKNGSVIPTERGANAQSGCNGGPAFACDAHSPFVVTKNVSFGFAAAKLMNMDEKGWCCACYELVFPNGKKMIVQVTNTGYDLGDNHFDLQIPGGGQGMFRGCDVQYANFKGGELYGGVSKMGECRALPKRQQVGCMWRFGWFENADNPDVMARRLTKCPKRLVEISKCERRG